MYLHIINLNAAEKYNNSFSSPVRGQHKIALCDCIKIK